MRGAGRFAMLAAGVCLAAALTGAPRADAVISNAHLVDGPSAQLGATDVDAAMAEDGTGGIVYLKEVDGRAHVFASQFIDAEWRAPQRIDVGQSFDSSWPQIGAGDGGRLVVTWVQEYGIGTDRMFSATLEPGSTGFQTPVPVDLNVGEATSTFPDLSMNRGGQAYMVYNVVTDTGTGNPPGYVGLDVRVARYGNRLWSVLGSPVDRVSTAPMRTPAAAIAPEIVTDIQGQAVVTWLEPDDEFIDRVWARRVFTNRVGIPLQVSPSEWEGLPLRGAADAFSLDVGGFGRAAVVFRQQPGQSSALTSPRMMLNEMPEVFSELAGDFLDPILIDGEGVGGLGVPELGVNPEGVFLAVYGSASATLAATGDEAVADPPERVDSGASSLEPAPVADFAETEAGVLAFRELRGEVGLVTAQERRADGVTEKATLSTQRGGAIGELELGGSGLGDGILTWVQGTGTGAQVAASVVDAPPDPFVALLPDEWQRGKRVPIAWQQTRNAVGGITYSISVDDEPVVEGVRGHEGELKRGDVDDGRHEVQVFAADDAGQETGSVVGTLLVDRNGPEITVKGRGNRIAVTAFDGARSDGSGVRSLKVSYGDGDRDSGKAKKVGKPARVNHRYKRRGRFTIRVKASDRAGNRVQTKRKVRVR